MFMHAPTIADETSQPTALDRARSLVALSIEVVTDNDREVAEAIAQRMAETGDCVVHAAYVVTGAKVCWCPKCVRTRLQMGSVRYSH